MKVFIAGARAISGLDDAVKHKLSQICDKRYDILVGDCYGVDAAVQRLCADWRYGNVYVYASNGKPRNNIGGWPVRNIEVPGDVRGFEYYRRKDLAMAADADCGFMIWDGKSRGTYANILELCARRKTTLVYWNGRFETLRSMDDIHTLMEAVIEPVCEGAAPCTMIPIIQLKMDI